MRVRTKSTPSSLAAASPVLMLFNGSSAGIESSFFTGAALSQLPLPEGEDCGEGPSGEVITMFVVYHPGYTVDIGPNHRFPMQKYRLVYERLLAEGTLGQAQVIQPDLVAMADLLLVHR